MSGPTLTTARLLLRPQRLEDFEPYAAYQASDRSIYEYGPLDRDQAWKAFASAVGLWALRGYGPWSVEDRASGAYLGEVGLFHHSNHPEAELGWMVLAEAEGRGVAHEAALAARDWAYRVRGLGPLVSYIDPQNLRSRRLAERLGARVVTDRPGSDPTDVVYLHPGPDGIPP